MKKFVYLLPMIVIISFVFLGCSKDESTTATTASTSVSAESGTSAITLSSKISVVDAKTSASTARTASSARMGSRTANAIDTTAFASTVDYNVDETSTYVYEKSSEALNTVNNILCQIGQTRPDLMVNEGNYKAQVDTTKCGSQSGDSKSGAPSYEMWTLNVSRASGEPMIAKVWVPDSRTGGIIYVKGEWYRSPSTEYPLGHFYFNFENRTSYSGSAVFYGYMSAVKDIDDNATTLKFYMPQDSSSWGLTAGTTMLQAVTATFSGDESGSGKTSLPAFSSQTEWSQRTYDISFNDNYFYKQQTTGGNAATAVCLDRNK